MKTFFLIPLLLLYSTFSFTQDTDAIALLLEETKSNTSQIEKVKTYIKLAEEYNGSDSLNTTKYANLAIDLAKKINYPEGKVDAYFQIGRNIIRLGYYDEGRQIFEKIVQEANQISYQRGKAKALNGLGIIDRYQGNYEQALKYYSQALNIQKGLGNKLEVSNIYNNIGIIYHKKGDYKKVLEYYFKALEIRKALGDKRYLLISYNNIGSLYKNQGNYRKSLEYHFKALEIGKELGNKNRMAKSYNNIAVLYKHMDNDKKALRYYWKALKIDKKLGNKRGIAAIYNNISSLYKNSGKYEKALAFNFKSLKIREELADKAGIASCYLVIGTIYEDLNEDRKVIKYISKSMEIYEDIGAKADIPYALFVLGKTYRKQGKLNIAQRLLKRGLMIAQEMNSIENIRDIAGELALVEEAKGHYPAAYKYHKVFKEMTDSLQNNEQSNTITRMEAEYEFKQEKDSIQFVNKSEKKLLQKDIANRKTTQLVTLIALGLLGVLLLILFLFFRSKARSNKLLTKKSQELEKANEKVKISYAEMQRTNEELQNSVNIIFESNQKNILMNQKLDVGSKVLEKAYKRNRKMADELKEVNKQLDVNNKVISKAYKRNQKITTDLKNTLNIVKKQKEEILDSMQYAQNIQNAILPLPEYFQTLLPQSFIFFKPQNIVSGDFYFLSKVKNKIVLAVVDCTGHGVPGAFMSLIGYNILVDIVIHRKISEANLILEELHQGIRFHLHQEKTLNRDGMDIALTVIDKENKTLEFAGAKNPIVYIQNNELKVIKGDKMPIGGEQREVKRVFISHQINISEPTTFYLFSDGIQDQFGGENNKKFTPKRLRNLLLDNHQKPMNEQKEILAQTIENWQKEGKEEQIDDMLLIGGQI